MNATNVKTTVAGVQKFIDLYEQFLIDDQSLAIETIKAKVESDLVLDVSKKVYDNFVFEYKKTKSQNEIRGLCNVYNYISGYEFVKDNFTLDELHVLQQKLFAYAPFPEYAGMYRITAAGFTKCDIDSCDYTLINDEMKKAGIEFKKIITMSSNIEKYIRSAVDLYARLIYILPFHAGNTTTIMAVFNLLLKYIGLPPIYLAIEDNEKYCSAMEEALSGEKNTEALQNLFLFKIASAVLENNKISVKK